MLLAFMGAEVIRVENRYDVRDIFRVRQLWPFNEINFNKKGVSLDLKHPEAVSLARRLVGKSDVVVENFSPGVMAKFGIDYPSLREVKPDLVMLSCTGFGQDGPEKDFASIAGTFAAMGGLSHITGYPDGIPTEQRSIFDMIVGQVMAFAIVSALIHRKRTGQGQYIDFSAREAIASLIGDVAMEYTLSGRIPGRKGNRDDIMAPHNCYRCAGEDRWVSIAVATDDEWRALCRAMGRPELAQEEKFADRVSRWKNQEEIDEFVNGWTEGQTPCEVTEKLQRVGVAAFPSMSSADIFADRHLKERGFLVEVDHPQMGKRFGSGYPWKFHDRPQQPVRPAPDLGQDNQYVFGQLLGLSQAEVEALEKKKAI